MSANFIEIHATYRVAPPTTAAAFDSFLRYQGGGGLEGSTAYANGSFLANIETREQTPQGDATHVRVCYALWEFDFTFGSLVSLISGMLPFYPGVRLISLELPPEILRGWADLGPAWGLHRLKERLGIYSERPLVGFIGKPAFLPLPEMGERIAQALRGGADLVKDDDLSPGGAEAAIRRIRQFGPILRREAEERGRGAIHFLFVTGALDDLLRVAEEASRWPDEIALLAAPALVGFDTIAAVRRRFPEMAMGIHPVCMQDFIAEEVFLGLLGRLAGGDLLVASAPRKFLGGLDGAGARGLAAAATGVLEDFAPACVGFGGGVNPQVIAELRQEIGVDCGALVGAWCFGRPGGVCQAFCELLQAAGG